MSKTLINTLTINPAIDHIIYLNHFTPNITNRAVGATDVLGGKGTHVSVNLGILNCSNNAYGIDYGKTGLKIESILQAAKVNVRFIHKEGNESRTNYALIENDATCTLVTEPSKKIPEQICMELVSKISKELNDGDILVLSGDASNTEVPHLYNIILDQLNEKKTDIKIFLDSSSDSLIEGIKRNPFLIKPNEDELSQILGHKINNEQEIISGLLSLAQKGITCIALTCGENGSYVYYQKNLYRIFPLSVNAVNTIGCGDAFLSGMAYGFEKHLTFIDTLRWAACVSAATAESNSTVGFELTRANELFNKVKIEIIS